MLPSQTSSGTSERRGGAVLPASSQPAFADAPVDSLARRTALTLIRGYQLALSPLFAGSCRFVPSCSAYTAEAIARFGVIRGTSLGLRRLARCHPFGGHGVDPVPAFRPELQGKKSL
jgi:putative membrane protein insertion efficiency factor